MEETKKDFTYRLIFYLSEIPIVLLGDFILKGDSRTPSLGFFIAVLFMVLGSLWLIRDVFYNGRLKFLGHLIGLIINIGLFIAIVP